MQKNTIIYTKDDITPTLVDSFRNQGEREESFSSGGKDSLLLFYRDKGINHLARKVSKSYGEILQI